MNTSITVLSVATVLALGAGFAPSGDVDALIQAFDDAESEWKEALRDADSDARRELRKHHPAATFWERFDAAANAGEGRALFWMATHLRDKGLKSSEVRAEKPALYARIFADHAGAEWVGEVLAQLPREKRYLEPGQVVGFYELAIEKNEGAEVRSQAMYRLGSLLRDSDDVAAREKGEGWLKQAAELADTEYGKMARAELDKPVVGELAPDFKGETIDGYEFNLSDYRGKVVLIDFYGFW